MKYRKKAVEIEAVELTWMNWSEIVEFVTLPWGRDGVREAHTENGVISDSGQELGLIIPTLEGEMLAVEGDYIIRGVKGEFYPCKPDIFKATYDSTENEKAKVFVLFEPGHYVDEPGMVWGVFSTREEAEKCKDFRGDAEIYEHTIDKYGYSDDL
ncbi:hypothetical protein [Listeria sp. SHR_NRA_18]|uniref:hypothetical protein n=1 Tax=Listeria sp. SHR_NRA_18 TaxID=2269046 RepID=UPI00268BDCBE